jgi:hypothetical protein
MTLKIGKNFCIAPFTQMTFNVFGGYSPCCEIGGRPWKLNPVDIDKMWDSADFNDLRESFLKNEKNIICQRCWSNEDNKAQSLRKRLMIDNPNKKKFNSGELVPFLQSGYKQGPSQINIFCSNHCNLRCRICGPDCSVTYGIEGKSYQEKYGKIEYAWHSKKPESLSQDHIDQIFSISENLTRIEFYGGEPLLDVPTLSLLEKLIASGQSKIITLFYNTNGTIVPSQKHYSLWQNFAQLEFNFSIDDIGKRFTYNRHPADWQQMVDNIASIRSYDWQISTKFSSICTVSNLNVFYLPEILDCLLDMDLPYFLNNVNGPLYYDIRTLPVSVKQEILTKLDKIKNYSQMNFIINMLSDAEDIQQWQQFKFWTAAKDRYRRESFQDTFPEYYQICRDYDPDFLKPEGMQ